MHRDILGKIFGSNAPFWSSWSIQYRLILLVLMSVLPALGIILHTGFEDQQNDVSDAKNSILRSVENLARLQDTITVSTKQMLMTVAQFPDVQHGNAQACNKLFGRLLRQSQHFSNIVATQENGVAFAAGNSSTDFNLADRDYFQQALKAKGFRAGGFVLARSNNVPVLPFAFPVMDDQEQIKGMVVAAVDLTQYGNFLGHMGFPEGSIVGIEDLNGLRLYRFPQLPEVIEEGIGRPLPQKIWRIISGSEKVGTYTELGADGIRRIYGFIQLRLPDTDKPYLYIRIGIPEESALLPAHTRLNHNLLLLSLAAICALGAAYFLGNLTIVYPLNQLVKVARQMATGNFHLRSGISHAKGGEIGVLAQSFDLMTSSLAQREIERFESEQAIIQLSKQNQLILNTAEEGIVGLDAHGLVVFINPAAAALTGYAAEELLGQSLHDRIHHSHPDGSAYSLEHCPMHKTLGQGTASRVRDEVLWRKDGTSFPAAYSSNPIVKNGTSSGAVITFRDITLRKKAEADLRRIVHKLSEHRFELEMQNEELRNTKVQLDIARERYFNLYDLAPVGYVTISEQGLIRESNRTAAHLLGVTRDMLSNRPFPQFIFKEDQDIYYLHRKQLFESDLPNTCELRLLKEDGIAFWANLTITTDPDESGEPLCRVAISDITERKHLAVALAASEQEFRTLAENSPDTIVRYDEKCRRVYVNPAMARLFDCPAAELLGKKPTDMSLMSDPAGFEQKMHAVLTSGQESEMEMALQSKDGRTGWGHLRIVPEFNADKEVLSLLVVGRNISALKEAENRLRASEQQLRTLSENSPGVMYSLLCKADGTMCMPYISPRIQELNGLNPAAMAADMSAANGRIHPGDRAYVLGSIAVSARNLSPLHIEFRWQHPEKGDVWVEGRSTPELQTDGSILLSGFFHDISKHKKLEKELFLAKKLEIIGQLAGGVAHEVRNPLNAILSITEALFTEKNIANNQEYQPYIEHIRTQVNRLSKLMTDLLSLGKSINPANIHSFSLNRLCSDTINLWQLSKKAEEHPVTLICDPTNHDPWVRTDSMHLQQALLNLLDNAAQCSPAGTGLQLKISEPDNTKVSVQIRDSGEGIHPQKIKRIFEPFFTLTKGGTGLGLTLVKHFIENMDGEVTLRNNDPPPGCTAELTLKTVKRESHEA